MLRRFLPRLVSRVPGLGRLPVFKLFAIAQIAMLVGRHISRLSPPERRRLLELVRTSRGRRRNLGASEREELAALVAKVEPRLFLGMTADHLSPLPLPRRVVHDPRRR